MKLKDLIINWLGGWTQDKVNRCIRRVQKDYEEELAKADKIIEELLRLDGGTPTDCKRGTWCEECGYAVKKNCRVGQITYNSYYCGKAEACRHLLRKEALHE